jgi:site-specific DNA recombinase
VRRALTRARVAGLIEHDGVVLGAGAFDAILTRAAWAEVRAAVSERSSEVRARYRGREHLLAGFLFCGVCAHRMKVSARRDDAGRVTADSFVSCIKDDGGCGRVKRSLHLLEAFVLPAVEARLGQVADAYDPDDDDPAARELARLWAQRDTLEAKIAGLQAQYEEDPELDAADYVGLVNRLRARVRAADAEIAAHWCPPRVAELPDDPVAAWVSGSFEDRRALLAAVAERIVLHPIGKVGPTRARAMVPQTTAIVWR